MSVMPDHQIRKFCVQPTGRPLIDPYDHLQLQPSSYDVLLAHEIRVPVVQHGVIDLRKPPEDDTELVDISHGFLLAQGHFILGSTSECVDIPDNLVGRIEGKSTRARQGLQIHSAGYLDPGFCGNVTLELVNFSPRPMLLFPGIRVAQLSFEWLSSACEEPYSNKRNHYQNSKGVIGPRGSGYRSADHKITGAAGEDPHNLPSAMHHDGG